MKPQWDRWNIAKVNIHI